MKHIINLFFAFIVTFSVLAFLFLINPSSCLSNEIFGSYGLGVLNTSSTKIIDFGYRYDFFSPWKLQVKGGGWLDGSNNPVHNSSFFLTSGPEYVVTTGSFEIRNGIGVGFISNLDSYLGSYLEFNPHVYLGVRDKDGNGLGVEYNHYSSAGIGTPNLGRDFIMIQLSERF